MYTQFSPLDQVKTVEIVSVQGPDNYSDPTPPAAASKKIDDDFDSDIRLVLDSGDLELVSQLVNQAGVDINFSLSSAFNWSLALYSVSRADYILLK